MSRDRPSCLTEPCPPWCHEDHAGQDHSADWYHQSRQILVPAVVPSRAGDGDVVHSSRYVFESAEIVVVVLQPTGEALHAWIAIAGERQSIKVSLEGAARLHAALGTLLNEVR